MSYFLGGKEILISLVDHNHDNEFDKIGKIVEIIDHHSVENENIKNESAKIIIDGSVGSCCTLVADKLFQYEHLIDTQIALLIYGPIILGNFVYLIFYIFFCFILVCLSFKIQFVFRNQRCVLIQKTLKLLKSWKHI